MCSKSLCGICDSPVETQRIEYKGQRILTEMFQIFESDPERLLPTNTANRWKNAPEQGKKRIICDYIAGMSDAYALKVYHQSLKCGLFLLIF